MIEKKKSKEKSKRIEFTPSAKRKIVRDCKDFCAFPNCNKKVVSTKITIEEEKEGWFQGHIAHIYPASRDGKGGFRYDEDIPESFTKSRENGFLLCVPHHDEIDDKENKIKYSAAVLLNMRENHITKIKGEKVTSSDLIMTESVKRFRGFSPSKKDLLDIDDINYCVSKLKKKGITPKAEERILSDISNNVLDIVYIETLKEDSKIALHNLLEFLFNYLKGKGESTLTGVLKILTWICRSEMLNSVKSIYYGYLKSLLDEKKRHYDLLEILFRFGHFEDQILWISTAIDERNIDFINILTGDLGSPKMKEQKSKIRDMLYEKLDIYEQNGKSEEIVQKINFLLEKLKNIKKQE